MADLNPLPPQSRQAWQQRDLWALLALLLLPFGVFAEQALLLSVFAKHDLQYYFYPYHLLPAQLVAQGQAPLWNPYAFSGIPLLGDGQTALFYPPNWFFFVLPGGAALSYAVLIQFSIAGMGLFLAARSQDLARLPALVGAVAYMFGGFLTARVVHLSILSGAALIPLLFFCVAQALRSQSRRWQVAAAGAVALQALAGHPQVPVYTALALGLYTLVQAFERRVLDERWRCFVRLPLQLALIYALGFGLAAIQLVPWFELARLSPRAAEASFDFVMRGSLHGGEWLLFIFPYLYGSLAPGLYAARPLPVPLAVKLWEHSAYVGILPLALAAVGLSGLVAVPRLRREPREDDTSQAALAVAAHRRWFTTLYFALLLLLTLLLAAGRYTPFGHVIYATPVLGKLREVERALALAAFALTMLAALGMQRLIEASARPSPRRPQLGVLLLAAATALIPLGLGLLVQQQAVQAALQLRTQDAARLAFPQPNAVIPLALALLSAILLACCGWRRCGPRIQALVLGLVLIDLASFAVPFNPTSDPQVYRYQPEVLAPLRADQTLFRKLTFLPFFELDTRTAQETLAISWSMVYAIEDVNGFNSLQPRRYTDYLFGPHVQDVSYGYFTDERLLQPQSPILSALNVKYLLVPTNVQPALGANFRQIFANAYLRVYENLQVYPRAYFVDRVRVEPDPRAVLAAVTADGFDGRREALIEEAVPPLPLLTANAPASVSIAHYTANQISLTSSTAEQRFLVLSDMDFPGWRASVDGLETPIYRANYLFRGIVVPPGQHHVDFVYQPASLRWGAALSLASLALAVVMLRRPTSSVFLRIP